MGWAGPAFTPCPGDQTARSTSTKDGPEGSQRAHWMAQRHCQGRPGCWAEAWHNHGMNACWGWECWGCGYGRDGLKKLVVSTHGTKTRVVMLSGRPGTWPHRWVQAQRQGPKNGTQNMEQCQVTNAHVTSGVTSQGHLPDNHSNTYFSL